MINSSLSVFNFVQNIFNSLRSKKIQYLISPLGSHFRFHWITLHRFLQSALTLFYILLPYPGLLLTLNQIFTASLQFLPFSICPKKCQDTWKRALFFSSPCGSDHHNLDFDWLSVAAMRHHLASGSCHKPPRTFQHKYQTLPARHTFATQKAGGVKSCRPPLASAGQSS